LKILILSDHDILLENQTSSVAIRQLYIAKKLSTSHKVTLATTFGKKKTLIKNGVKHTSGLKTLNLVNKYDVVIIELSSSTLSIAYKYVKSPYKKPTIVDSYYAIIFEKLITLSKNDNFVFSQKLNVIRSILEKGDHYICATPRQKDYVLGLTSLLSKINPKTFKKELISVLPNTFVATFNPKNKVLRKDYFSKDDKIILFLGSIYPWFNPIPLILAMPRILKKVKNAKLLILGGKHPSGFFEKGYNQTVELSKKLNLYDKNIKFLNWVTKEESFAYTSEADLSILISKSTLEDEFAYRTRILTPLLLGIPTMTNGKDYISCLIQKYQAGVVITQTKPEVISKEIIRIFLDKRLHLKISNNTKMLIKHIKNDIDIKPLMNFLREPKINKINLKDSNLSQLLSSVKTKINLLR